MKELLPPGYMKPLYTEGYDMIFRLDNGNLHKVYAKAWEHHIEVLLCEGKIKKVSDLVPIYIPTGKRKI